MSQVCLDLKVCFLNQAYWACQVYWENQVGLRQFCSICRPLEASRVTCHPRAHLNAMMIFYTGQTVRVTGLVTRSSAPRLVGGGAQIYTPTLLSQVEAWTKVGISYTLYRLALLSCARSRALSLTLRIGTKSGDLSCYEG